MGKSLIRLIEMRCSKAHQLRLAAEVATSALASGRPCASNRVMREWHINCGCDRVRIRFLIGAICHEHPIHDAEPTAKLD